MKNINTLKQSSKRKNDVNKAKRNFQKIQKKIKPFIKTKKYIQSSTKGNWKSSEYST